MVEGQLTRDLILSPYHGVMVRLVPAVGSPNDRRKALPRDPSTPGSRSCRHGHRLSKGKPDSPFASALISVKSFKHDRNFACADLSCEYEEVRCSSSWTYELSLFLD